MQQHSNHGAVWRIDKFAVPAAARDEFLDRVAATHAVLRQQPGFVRDELLEQVSGPGEFNIVTIALWQTQAHIDAAREAVTAMHRQTGFDPKATLARLGIRADIANYRTLQPGTDG